MKNNQIKISVILAFAFLALAVFAFQTNNAVKVLADGDIAADYKKNMCSTCHTATASKHFDTNKTDDELVKIILEGKKGEKPPFMPAYKDKLQMTAEQAKVYVDYMRKLRTENPVANTNSER